MIISSLLALGLSTAVAQDTGDTGFAPPPIVGGTQSSTTRWPDVVWVDMSNSICTGTLVGPRTVITAAHCDEGIRGVYVGGDDYYYDPGTFYRASSSTSHPSYTYDGFDIAVITLEQPVSGVAPRQLAIGCAAGEVVDGASAWIAGYGSTSANGGGNNSALYEAQVTVVDADCSEDPWCDSSMPYAGELFAGGDGIDSCFGDSGGPLYVQTSYGNLLVGVTSRVGYEAGTVGPSCGPGGIYTRADTLIDWVQSVSVDTLAGPTCNQVPEIILQPFGEVGNKGTYSATFAINDPDSTSWTYSLPQAPSFGTIQIDGNQLKFTGDGAYVGADSFIFRVTDDSGGFSEVTVPLTIAQGRVGGCGCATSGVPGGLWTLPLLGLILLRRSRD